MNRILGLLTVALGPFALTLSARGQGAIELIDVGNDGTQAASGAFAPAITPDGRFVAFVTDDGPLWYPADQNQTYDVLLRDRWLSHTEPASAGWNEANGNGPSFEPSISDDGMWIGFLSQATNFAVPAPFATQNYYVRSRFYGTVSMLTTTSQGYPDGPTYHGQLSGNGLWVVFECAATNLISGDTNGVTDVFVTPFGPPPTIERVSVREDGSQAVLASHGGTISADGRYVAFSSLDALVASDTNGLEDVYLRDRQTGQLRLVSVGLGGAAADGASTAPALAAGGSALTFVSEAQNLVAGDTNGTSDVFVIDVTGGFVERVSRATSGTQSDGASSMPKLSGDGRIVSFTSAATNLVPGVPQLVPDNRRAYAHDRGMGVTLLLDSTPSGIPGDGASGEAVLTQNGRFAAFSSASQNLVPNDLFGVDVLVRDRAQDPPVVYCTAKNSSLGCTPQIGWSGVPSATSGLPFVVSTTNVNGATNGILFYGFGPRQFAFQGGWLCIASPLVRTPVMLSSGTPGACSGVFTFDFNARIGAGIDPRLVPGALCCAQVWFRDAGDIAGFGSGLSDAIHFTIQP